MTLCTQCNSKIPTLSTRLRKVNNALHELGMTYHTGIPAASIDTILINNGFKPTETWHYQVDGFYTYDIGEGAYLHASVYKMPSGRYEIVAYAN
jgi:hypothetical protein